MKNTLKLITLFFVCAFVQSCQKDLVDTQNPLVPPVIIAHDSVIVLSKFLFVDINVSATDTTGSYEYVYDSLKRVTAINYYDGNNNTASLGEISTYYYKGSDTLAYKMTEKDFDPSYPHFFTTLYFYDNLKRLIKDSLIYSPADFEVDQFNYSNNMIIATLEYTNNNDPRDNSIETDTGFIGTTGDVIKTNTLVNRGINGYYIDNFTFDNNPNPFYQLNIRSTYNPVPDFNFFLEGYYLQKNNVVLDASEDPFNHTLLGQGTYTYTYNALGFPATVDIIYDGGSTDDTRMVFIYEKIF